MPGKKKYKLNKSKFFNAMPVIIGTFVLVYLGICYMDILLHNLNNPSYGEWNMLVKLITGLGGIA